MVSSSSSGPARVLLVHHVARRLGVSNRTVRWWAETGRVPGRRLNVKIWVFAELDVIEFARTRGVDRSEAA